MGESSSPTSRLLSNGTRVILLMHLDFQATGKLKFTFLFNSRREFVWINTIFYFHLLYSFVLYYILKNSDPDPGLILKLTKACEINRIRNLGTINLNPFTPKLLFWHRTFPQKKEKKWGKYVFATLGKERRLFSVRYYMYIPLCIWKVVLLGWNSWEKSSL